MITFVILFLLKHSDKGYESKVFFRNYIVVTYFFVLINKNILLFINKVLLFCNKFAL